ncbi:hypothetical protein BKA62DRAFT_705093 [Auriculariales sp. MPI-PUGE-AT-0066]|nr:hypothetical protein BKA62DRAFT_705093 [Auriculariales sp. MPI-PUGE-AT-0066]
MRPPAALVGRSDVNPVVSTASATATDSQGYTVTLQATDPAVRFGGYVDYPECNCGWTTTFEGGVAPATFGQLPGEMGVGKGTRAATTAGSFVMFEFYGSSIAVSGWIRGGVVVSSFLAFSDLEPINGVKNVTEGVIFELTGLDVGWHLVKLNITKEGSGGAQFGVDHVVYTIGLPDRLQKTHSYLPDDDAWDLQGQWSRSDLPNISNPGQTLRTLVTKDGNASANIAISGLSVLYLYGNVHAGSDRFQVTTRNSSLEDLFPFYRQSYSRYAREDVVLWWAIIPDESLYHVSILNTLWDDTPSKAELELTRLDIYQLDDGSVAGADNSTSEPTVTPPSAHKSSAGAIAGGVFGSILALGLIIFGVFLLRRRHRKDNRLPVPYEDDQVSSMRPVTFTEASSGNLALSNHLQVSSRAFTSSKGSSNHRQGELSSAPAMSGSSHQSPLVSSPVDEAALEAMDGHGWQAPPRYQEPTGVT